MSLSVENEEDLFSELVAVLDLLMRAGRAKTLAKARPDIHEATRILRMWVRPSREEEEPR